MSESVVCEVNALESKHDFGASSVINHAVQTIREATRISDLRRTEKIMGNAGVLAAREAVSYGIEIKGWEEDLDKLPQETREKIVQDGEGRAYINYELSQLEQLPDRYQILANLADSYELRRIRQTESHLITTDRELRFALARVEEARRILEREEAEFIRLEGVIALGK